MTAPAIALLRRLLSPDDLGHAVTPEVRRLAADVLRHSEQIACVEPAPKPSKRIYLSGPMTGMPGLNFPAFNVAAARLRDLGHEVVNPAELNKDPAARWHECLRVDLKALLDCNTIALLDGWQKSNGAHLEMHVAHRVGIDIVLARDLVS